MTTMACCRSVCHKGSFAILNIYIKDWPACPSSAIGSEDGNWEKQGKTRSVSWSIPGYRKWPATYVPSFSWKSSSSGQDIWACRTLCRLFSPRDITSAFQTSSCMVTIQVSHLIIRVRSYKTNHYSTAQFMAAKIWAICCLWSCPPCQS